MRKGFLVIVSAPSGTGKSTICRELLRRRKNLTYSISCTTRPPRPGEKQGKNYHFLSKEEFRRRIRYGEFLEWAKVHDHYYGTSKSQVLQKLLKGKNVLLDLDVQGARSIQRKHPDSVLIFVSPPSWTALKQRLVGRKGGKGESIKTRLRNAREELLWAKEYDYIVLNDKLSNAVRMSEAILDAEEHRVDRINHSFGLIPKVT